MTRRILLGALLLETTLLVITIPIGELFGSPFAFNVDSRARDPHIFFVAVPVACACVGYLVGRWVTRYAVGSRALYGLLLSVAASALYFALISARPGGAAQVILEYGPAWFAVAQSARILGCVAGAASGRRQAETSPA